MAEDPFASIAEPAAAPSGGDPFASIAEPAAQTQQEPQTPGFFKRLTAPYNPDAEDRNPVIRTLDAAGGALLGTPGAVYHAFADKPTEEENTKYHGDTGGLKRVGLGLERLVVDPVEGAAKDYASGKVTPEGALSVLPEAIGVGIGSQAAGELSGRGLSKVGELRTQFKDSMGGGKLQPFARKFTGVESELKKTVTKAAEKNAAAEATHGEATETAAERQGLAKRVDEGSVKLGQQLAKVEDSVAKEANQKFQTVREKIGNPETDPAPLIEAVKGAEDNILQGIPENIKEFRSILGHGEEAPAELAGAFEEATGSAPEGAMPVTWDKLQSLKSRIDTRLRQASRGARMNGDLKRALYSVQSSIVETMGQMAEANGAADLWADAKNTWRQYKEDFHEPSGPSGSGSPVAAALNAADPKNIRQPFVRTQSTLGNRGVDILKKYPQHGGTEAAATAEELMGHHENLRKMGSDKAIKPVKTPTVDALQVSRDAIARRASRWGDFNARDIGILASSGIGEIVGSIFGANPGVLGGVMTGVGAYEGGKYFASRALNNPKVIDWLSKTPPAEVAALQKIPGADKVRIVNALTDTALNTMPSEAIPGGSYESSFTKAAKPENNPAKFNSKTSDYDAHLLTLKDANGNRAGSLSWHPAPGEPAVAEVHDSGLNPEYRGKGIGKEMYRQAIEDARRKGFKVIRADHEISPDAVRVWNSLGAKTVTDSLGRSRLQLDIPAVPPVTVKLSPAAVQLIGPANVARIAAATGSVAATRVQNRKDALDLLNTQ